MDMLCQSCLARLVCMKRPWGWSGIWKTSWLSEMYSWILRLLFFYFLMYQFSQSDKHSCDEQSHYSKNLWVLNAIPALKILGLVRGSKGVTGNRMTCVFGKLRLQWMHPLSVGVYASTHKQCMNSMVYHTVSLSAAFWPCRAKFWGVVVLVVVTYYILFAFIPRRPRCRLSCLSHLLVTLWSAQLPR